MRKRAEYIGEHLRRVRRGSHLSVITLAAWHIGLQYCAPSEPGSGRRRSSHSKRVVYGHFRHSGSALVHEVRTPGSRQYIGAAEYGVYQERKLAPVRQIPSGGVSAGCYSPRGGKDNGSSEGRWGITWQTTEADKSRGQIRAWVVNCWRIRWGCACRRFGRWETTI